VAYQGALTFLPLPQFMGRVLFVLALGLGAIGQVLAGTLADRRRPDRILFSLSLAGAILLGLLSALIGWSVFGIVALAFGFVLFSLEALQNTLVARTAPHSLRGVAFGLSFFSVFGLGSIGAVLSGWLLARGDAPLMFLVLGGALATSGAMAYGVGAMARTG
jgi:predicted MFS family arabinose efflux permease